MDIDDELVMEVDVVLNSPQPINLLQYPLRPRYRPYGDQGTLLSASLSQDHLDLHYSLSSNTINYDRANAEFKRDTQVLTGTLINPLTKYCVGYFTNGTLSLTPLEKLMQIRPNTNYLDLCLDKNVEDKEEIAQIKQDKDSKKLRVFKKKEAKTVVQDTVEINLACFDMKSKESTEALHKLLPFESRATEEISAEAYMTSILPTPLKSTGLRDCLRALPISLALEELLKSCVVISLEEVQDIFINEKNLESMLMQKAVAISQRWVCKSEVSGDGTERDVCAYLLWKKGSVCRSE